MKTTTILAFFAIVMTFASCQKEAQDLSSKSDLTDQSLKSGQSKVNFVVHLSGLEEVPSNPSIATGTAVFILKFNGTELHYNLIVNDLENLLASHIHIAPAGTNGPVVAWLYPSGPPPMLIEGLYSGLLAQGVITGSSLVGPLAGQELSVLVEYLASGNAYVNVHTLQYPGGEIRGQF